MNDTQMTVAQLQKPRNQYNAHNLPLYQIVVLLDELKAKEQIVKSTRALLHNVLADRFTKVATARRLAAGVTAGAQQWDVDGCTVTANAPEIVTWDVVQLRETAMVLEYEGYTPDDYITTRAFVSEAAFASMPDEVRALIEPARIVTVGTQMFRVEKE